jgi:7-carboxy-7-deazaguanine synthase
MSLDAVLDAVRAAGARYVTVTGGEPLAQKNCLPLLERLCDAGFDVSLETGGAIDVAPVDARVVKILDIKTPGSGESGRNLSGNLGLLTIRDQVKFVICDRADYEWSRDLLRRERLEQRCEVLFSPSHGQLAPGLLADWILADRLPVRLQIQLHKLLWGDVRGR